MDTATEHDLNQAAYRQLKDTIASSYPSGHFVAIAEGRIVADAATFAELRSLLLAMGKNPVHVVIVQAGVTYPEYAIIFADRT